MLNKRKRSDKNLECNVFLIKSLIFKKFYFRGSWWKPKFNILNENHDCILRIEGPCCIFDGPFCCGDSNFRVLSLNGDNEIGKVTKKYSSFAREAASTADNFTIECIFSD